MAAAATSPHPDPTAMDTGLQQRVARSGRRTVAAAAPPPAERCADPDLRRFLAAGSAGILALRGVSLALAVATRVLLARLLGADGFGDYETAMAWLAVLGVPAGLGAEKLLVRCAATYRAEQRWSLLRGLLRGTTIAVLATSSALAVGAALAVAACVEPVPAGLLAAAVLLPCAALMRVQAGFLQGMHRVVAGQLPELVLAPLGLAVLLGAEWLTGARELGAGRALGWSAAAGLAALAVAAVLVRRTLPAPACAALPTYDRAAWVAIAGPLLAVGGLQVLNARADVVLLGWLADAGDVGRYAAAQRAANLIGVVLLAANGALAPVVARLHAAGPRAELQDAVSRSARLAFATACPLALGLIAARGPLLGLFGADFTSAGPVLVVLACGQLFQLAMGPAFLILLMTGHTGDAVRGLLVSGAAQLVLGVALIPRFGPDGAAVATAVTMALWSVLLARAVRRRLGIRPGVIAPLGGARP